MLGDVYKRQVLDPAEVQTIVGVTSQLNHLIQVLRKENDERDTVGGPCQGPLLTISMYRCCPRLRTPKATATTTRHLVHPRMPLRPGIASRSGSFNAASFSSSLM